MKIIACKSLSRGRMCFVPCRIKGVLRLTSVSPKSNSITSVCLSKRREPPFKNKPRREWRHAVNGGRHSRDIKHFVYIVILYPTMAERWRYIICRWKRVNVSFYPRATRDSLWLHFLLNNIKRTLYPLCSPSDAKAAKSICALTDWLAAL